MPGTRPCAHWAQFRCNYGEACNFNHDGPGGPSNRGIWPGALEKLAGRQVEAEVQDAAGEFAADVEEQNAILAAMGFDPSYPRMSNAGAAFTGAARQDTTVTLSPMGMKFPQAQEAPASGGPVKYKTKLCNHWQQFKCNYGDACNFSHDGPGGPSARGVFPAIAQAQAQAQALAEAAQAQVEAQEALQIAAAAAAAAGGDDEQAITLEQQNDMLAAMGFGDLTNLMSQLEQQAAGVMAEDFGNPQPQKRKTRPCAHWANYRCNHGDACNFNHEGPGGYSERGVYFKGVQQAAEKQQQTQGGVVVNPLMQQLQQVISANQSRAAIDMHQGRSFDEQGLSGAQQGRFGGGGGGAAQSICKHFLSGKCNYGAACRFSHDTDAPGAGVSPRGVYPGLLSALTAEGQAPSNHRFSPY